MKVLSDIIAELQPVKITGDKEIVISEIHFDSRQVKESGLFVAVRGSLVDGHNYIKQAIEAGCSAVICEEMPEKIKPGICYVSVKDSANALGITASAFYNHPSRKLKLVGVTGTNGKTTIASLLYKLFSGLGYKCGLLSTIQNLIGTSVIKATHTTPDPLTINRLMSSMLAEGCTHCFMEVSSHAIDQQRIAGIHFSGGVFTNITHDHLDYHKTFSAYLKTKKGFFDSLPPNAFALTNIDDRNGEVILQASKARRYSYSIRNMADFRAKMVENHFDGLNMIIDGKEVWFKLVGEFNASNLMAIYGVAKLLGVPADNALRLMSGLEPAEGRFEYIRSATGIIAVVDYAHTPDALKNVLQTLCQIGNKDKKIITVVGAGGNRDKTKRPLMASIAMQYSDKVVLTSDNPRDEDPDEIIEEMCKGVEENDKHRLLRINRREDAINVAVSMAQDGDVVLVAGKGHEKYQEIKGVKHPFDDKKVLSNILLNR